MMCKVLFVLSVLVCAGHRWRIHDGGVNARLNLPSLALSTHSAEKGSGGYGLHSSTTSTDGEFAALLLSLHPRISSAASVKPNLQASITGVPAVGSGSPDCGTYGRKDKRLSSSLSPRALLSSRRPASTANISFLLPRRRMLQRRRLAHLGMHEGSDNVSAAQPPGHDGLDPLTDFNVTDALNQLNQRTAGYRACAGAAMGNLLVGFNTGVIAGALLFIIPEFGLELRPQITGLLASSMTIGALFGTLISSKLSDRLGRRLPLLLSSLSFLLCGVLMGCAPTARALIIARLISGIAAGVVTCVVPTYIAECAETSERGKLAALPQLGVSSGILLSYIVGLFSLTCGASWRLMLAFSIVPAVLQAIVLCFLPESPRWLLLHRNDSKRALASLRSLRGTEDVSKELENITAGLSRERDATGEVSGENVERIGLIGILQNRRTRRTLFICFALQCFQQFCGVNAIVYFTPQILKQAGVSSLFLKYGLSADAAAMLATVCAYVPKIPSAILAGYLIDRLGRRWMLKVFIPLLGVCLATLGWSLGTAGTTFSAMAATIAVTLFGVFFTMSLGPLPTLLTSELFSTSTRSASVAAAATVQFTANVLVAQLFPVAAVTYGMRSVINFFAVVCALAWVVVLIYVPETKGRTLEEIQDMGATED